MEDFDRKLKKLEKDLRSVIYLKVWIASSILTESKNKLLLFRYFKGEVTSAPNGEARINVLRQIKDVEKDILSTLQQQKDVLDFQNRNMTKAIEIIEERKRREQQ
jgi:hypothetical protein